MATLKFTTTQQLWRRYKKFACHASIPMPWTIMLFRQQGCYHVVKVGFLYDCNMGFFLLSYIDSTILQCLMVFGFLSLNFWFFFTEKKSYSKLCSLAKVGYKRGKRKWEKIEWKEKRKKERKKEGVCKLIRQSVLLIFFHLGSKVVIN
jgi:hypothetical protein